MYSLLCSLVLKALLTLLISNNFAEIKSSVFKKFDKHNLFQLSCHDVVERFKLALFLAMIMLLNVCQGGLDDPVSQVSLNRLPVHALVVLILAVAVVVVIDVAGDACSRGPVRNELMLCGRRRGFAMRTPATSFRGFLSLFGVVGRGGAVELKCHYC